MRQVLQNLRDGQTSVQHVPVPQVGAGHLLIRSRCSLISAGTERMLVDFGRANFIAKARQQPDKVRQVLNKIRTDGLAPTLATVRAKLDQPIPMGYSNVGQVVAVGSGVEGFPLGSRVVSNGHHAEFVSVPSNLCALIPDSVPDDSAAFTVLGAIALQGIRLIAPTIGEAIVVSGLGLIGLIAVQVLRANGCRVLGLDFDPRKLELARQMGAEVLDLSQVADPVPAALAFSRGRGVDGVLVAASTKSSDPIRDAAQMCRKRGRIVLVGVTGLDLSRADFYEKELSFQVSCSYGPGRYDSNYEIGGHDYPIGFVRWTEQRNFEAVLDLMAAGHLDVRPLISRRYLVDAAADAYADMTADRALLGLILDYPENSAVQSGQTIDLSSKGLQLVPGGAPVVSAIGAGNYAGRTLLPAFARTGVRLRTIASATGLTGAHVGAALGFERTTTDLKEIWDDPMTNVVVISTQHDTHATLVCRALECGKHVFVEKPLGLSRQEIEAVAAAYKAAHRSGTGPLLMVGFNRRFAPLVTEMKRRILPGQPLSLVYTCNAGAIPGDHWTQDSVRGGGRIIGEACHFLDLSRFLVGAPIRTVQVSPMRSGALSDTATISLGFADGSIATVHYFANGHRGMPKERVEVFQAGRVMVLDNFRRLMGFGVSGLVRKRLWSQDKGQLGCVQAFVKAVENGAAAPIGIDELLEVSRASIDAADCAAER